MPTKIKNINIKAFRGIPCCELPLEENSLLLIGENGTGKSSIVDAIEFFFTGEVASLKRLPGISLKKSIPHKNYDVGDVKVEMTFTGNEKLVRSFELSPVPPSNFNKYFKIVQEGTFILHRKQLMEFIDVPPAERFKAITNLIGINRVSIVEKEMRQANNTLKRDVEQKTRFLEDIIHDISNIIGQNISNADDVLPIINKLLEKNELPIIESFEKVSEHKEKMYRFTKSSKKVDMFQSLQEILRKSEEFIIKEDLCKQIKNLDDEILQLKENNLKNTLSLLDTLKTGKIYLKNETCCEICPICEQHINKELLLDQIEKRYKTLEEVTKNYSRVKKEVSKLSIEIKIIVTNIDVIISKLDMLNELNTETNELTTENSVLQEIQKEFEIPNNEKLRIPSIEFISVTKNINKILSIIIKKGKDLESKIELTEDENKFLSFVEMIIKVTSKIEDLKKANDSLEVSLSYFKIAEKIYETFSTLKRNKIQNIFDSIKTDIQEYYSFLHPTDPHRNIDLKIKGKGTSAVLEIESFGLSGSDPRAFTSEGHLDTLGLCIFLAFVKKFNQECSLIILDDIVTTVDSAHRESICRLLFEKFKKKQFIITTHDGLWFQQIGALINAYGLENKFVKSIIYRWEEDNGPSIKAYKFKWETIPKKIESGDKSCAGNEIRQYLEWVLENICKSTQAKLPISDHGYTVGELEGPARGRLKDLIEDQEIKNNILNTFKDIDKSIMGNLLSHHNELAINASIDDVKRLFESVNNLHMLVSCPSCKRFLKYESNADRLICSNKCNDPVIIKTNMS